MQAKFAIEQKESYFSFTFTADNGNLVFVSRLFRTRQLCSDGLKELIALSTDLSSFEKAQDKYGQYSFAIKNKKGVSLGHSPIYYAFATRDYAMRQLSQQAQLGRLEEQNPVGVQ